MASEPDWEKKAKAYMRWCFSGPTGDASEGVVLAALRLGREMADARAEEIAKAIEAKRMARPHQAYFSGYEGQHNADMDRCANIARSFIFKKPESKAREQALEEALWELYCKAPQITPELACMVKRVMERRGDA